MGTALGAMFKQVRASRSQNLAVFAAALGYRNLNRGSRRVERLERYGTGDLAFVHKVGDALGVSREQVAELVALDQRAADAAFEAWASVPQAIELVRFVCGVTATTVLREGTSDAEAIVYAEGIQKEQRLRVCLVLDRRRSMWFGLDGSRWVTQTKANAINKPFTTIG